MSHVADANHTARTIKLHHFWDKSCLQSNILCVNFDSLSVSFVQLICRNLLMRLLYDGQTASCIEMALTASRNFRHSTDSATR